MNIQSTYRGPKTFIKPKAVDQGYVFSDEGMVLVPTGYQKGQVADKDKPDAQVKLGDIMQGLSGGGIATGSLKMYQLSNTTTHSEVTKFLTTNNFAPDTADKLASNVMDTVNSVAGKAAFIGVAGGAATYGVLEVLKPEWPVKKKAAWSLVVTTILVVGFLILAKLGVTQ